MTCLSPRNAPGPTRGRLRGRPPPAGAGVAHHGRLPLPHDRCGTDGTGQHVPGARQQSLRKTRIHRDVVSAVPLPFYL